MTRNKNQSRDGGRNKSGGRRERAVLREEAAIVGIGSGALTTKTNERTTRRSGSGLRQVDNRAPPPPVAADILAAARASAAALSVCASAESAAQSDLPPPNARSIHRCQPRDRERTLGVGGAWLHGCPPCKPPPARLVHLVHVPRARRAPLSFSPLRIAGLRCEARLCGSAVRARGSGCYS